VSKTDGKDIFLVYKVESQICSAVPSNREPHRTLQGSVAVSVELEERSGDGSTPLHWAADNGHLPVVQYLCEQGADKDSRDDDDDNTPLHFAARDGNFPVVQYLCEQGAGKEARSGRYWTPLHCAADNGHLPVVQYLCEQGADKDSRDDDDDNTLLHFAALHGHLPVVQCLCELGADKKVRDRGGNTYLDFAAAYRSPLCTDQDGDY